MAECLLFKSGGGATSDDCTATRDQVLEGVYAITADSDGEPVEGTIPRKAAQTYYVTTSDQVINRNQYLEEDQVISKVTQTNYSAGNIKSGVTISVNNGSSNVYSVEGTFTKNGTQSSGQTVAAAGNIVSGYSAWVNGSEVKGSIASRSASNTTTNRNGTAITYYAGYYPNNWTVSTAAASGTYTCVAPSSNKNSTTYDMGDKNSNRYVNAANVYNQGVTDGKNSASGTSELTGTRRGDANGNTPQNPLWIDFSNANFSGRAIGTRIFPVITYISADGHTEWLGSALSWTKPNDTTVRANFASAGTYKFNLRVTFYVL